MKILILFVLVYTSMNYYFYSKLKHAITLSLHADIAIFYTILVLTFAPLLIQVVVTKQFYGATVLAYATYFWLGFIFLFTCAALLVDCYHGIAKLLFTRLQPSPLLSFVIPAVVTICISCYGVYAANNIQPTTITIKSPKITHKFTIAQISDAHLSYIVNEHYLHKMLDIVKQANPDALVATGDLIDIDAKKADNFAAIFRTINPPYGKYAVTGNHEFYLGLPIALDFFKAAGFKALRQETANITDQIVFAGVDDPAVLQMHWLKEIPETKILAAIPKDKYVVLLKHQPLINDSSLPYFDLQLSGHTHQGQIFPFSLVAKLFYRYVDRGLYNLGKAKLYVSSGAGTWGPPIRFLAPAEVVIINLEPEKL